MNRKYTKEILDNAVQKSKTWANVCRLVGVTPATGGQTHIKSVAIKMGIDFSHFLGHAVNRGRRFGFKRTLQDYLDGRFAIKSHELKKRLFKEGLKEEKCERCNASELMGEKIPLELDHINNNHQDNRLENLEILCPNCHAIKTRKARMAKKQTHCA